MIILIVSPKFDPVIGGGETYVLNIARQLHVSGHKVIVATAPHNNRVLNSYPFRVAEIEGLDDDFLNIHSAIPKLFQLREDLRPDIIHAHGYFALLTVGLTQQGIGCTVIASIHSTPVWGERIFGSFKSFTSELAFAKNIFALSKPKMLLIGSEAYQYAAEKITQGLIPLELFSYPVDINLMRSGDQKLREEFGISQERVVITIPSRILLRKGIREAVCSLRHLPDEYILCLPGAHEPLDKDYWADIQAQPGWEKLNKRVIIPGRRIGYDDLPDLYAMSNIVAMPSYYEGFGLAALEAMAAGTPVIGTKVQGLQQLIANGINGLSIPSKNVPSLVKAIIKIQNSDELRNKLIAGGMLTATGYSLENHVTKLINIYENA